MALPEKRAQRVARKTDSRAVLLQQFGALAADPTLPALRKAIYAARGRPETEEGFAE